MNDHDTTALRDGLDRLADQITPQVDVVGLVRGSRERNRRQRRGRMTMLAVATATAVAVPVGIGVLDGPAPDGRDAAGPGADAEDRRSEAAEQARLAAERAREEAEMTLQERLESGIAAIADALDEPGYTGSTVSLTAPAGTFPCPEDTGELQAALGGINLDHRGGLLPGDTGACSWSVPGSATGDAEDFFAVEIGFTPGWTAEDVSDGPPLGDGCSRRHVIPAATGGSMLLDACPQGSGTLWLLFALDSSGSGVWTFLASAGEDQPVDGPAAMVAVVELADRTW